MHTEYTFLFDYITSATMKFKTMKTENMLESMQLTLALSSLELLRDGILISYQTLEDKSRMEITIVLFLLPLSPLLF